MKLPKLTEEQTQVLNDIQKSIPKEWTDNTIKVEKVAPVTKEIIERALEDPDVPEKDKEEYRLVLNSGYLDMEIEKEQEDIKELIDAFVEKEILKAVAAKKLPKPKKRRDFKQAYKVYKEKLKNYEQKNRN